MTSLASQASALASQQVFVRSVLTHNMRLNMAKLYQHDLEACLLEGLTTELEGRCAEQGFIKPGSISLLDVSNGKLKDEHAIFTVQCSAEVALPAEGQVLQCVVENISHAGLTCSIKPTPDAVSPYIINVFRDHHHTAARLAKHPVGSVVSVKVVSFGYVIRDPSITITAFLNDGVTESAELDPPMWTTEIVDTMTVSDIQANPKKMYAVDNSRFNAKSAPNVIELNTKDFSTTEKNCAIIDRFIHDVQSAQAKTIVFSKDFGESIRTKDPDTYRYLEDKLKVVGFHTSKAADRTENDSATEDESDGDY
jgi:DNA-directed RNA polymerase subunit E'/Rpb7